MGKDLISVIVPVYNVEKYLKECLDSICRQTYKNLEIILIDDGSNDLSGKICDEYLKKDCRIKVIHTENKGVCSARNIGMEKAKGKWITFVDSDDWIEEEFCEELYREIIKENCDVALCGYYRVIGKNREKINCNIKEKFVNSNQYLIKSLNPQTGYGFSHMKLYRSECIRNVKFNEKLVVGEDALFNEMISENIKKGVMVSKPLYNYRINQNSVVKRYDKKYFEKYLKSIIVNKEYIFDKYYENRVIIQNYYNYVAFHVLLVAVNYCFNPQNNKQYKTLKEICNNKYFKEGIKKSNYDSLSLTRKITLFTIKIKLYLLTGAICKYRQKQNRKS